MSDIKQTNRNYGIDLLRMVSMLMVVFLHVLGRGGILAAVQPLSSNYAAAWFLEISTYCAVNCYALISGYVSSKSSEYKYTPIVLLWLRVVFYTVLIAVVFKIIAPETVGIKTFVKAFLPVSMVKYWYFTAYVLLYFFQPLLNTVIEHMPRKNLKQFLIISIALLSILPTILQSDLFHTHSGYSAFWLIILYIMGGYIKKYNALSSVGSAKAFLGYFLCVIVTWGYKLIVELWIPTRIAEILNGSRLVSYVAPTVFAAGVFLLIGFSKLSVRPSVCRIIKIFSPVAFSVYVIHCEPLMWDHVIRNRFAFCASLSTPLLVVAVIGIAIGIYVGCSLIDLVREFIFKKLKIKEHLMKIETTITEKVHRAV